MVQLKGIFNVFDPSIPVACLCVFKASWVQRSLSIKEVLRIFDTPLAMDDVLITDKGARNVMQRGITPIVVSAIFCALWPNSMGAVTASVMAQQGLTAHNENKLDETGREVEVEADPKEREIVWRSGWRCCSPIVRVGSITYPERTRWEAATGQLKTHHFISPRPLEPAHESITPSPSELLKQEHNTPSLPEWDLFAKLKQEHDLAKAVKSDNAEVPVDLWDQAVCRAPPLEVEKKALTVVRDFMLA